MVSDARHWPSGQTLDVRAGAVHEHSDLRAACGVIDYSSAICCVRGHTVTVMQR